MSTTLALLLIGMWIGAPIGYLLCSIVFMGRDP